MMKKVLAMLLAALTLVWAFGAYAETTVATPATVETTPGTAEAKTLPEELTGSWTFDNSDTLTTHMGFRLNADGTGALLTDGSLAHIGWELSGNRLTLKLTGAQEDFLVVTAAVEGDTLTLTYTGNGYAQTLRRGWEDEAAPEPVTPGSEAEKLLGDWLYVSYYIDSDYVDEETVMAGLNIGKLDYTFREDGTAAIYTFIEGQEIEGEVNWTLNEGNSLRFAGQQVNGQDVVIHPYVEGDALVLVYENKELFTMVGINGLGLIMARPEVTLTQEEIDALVAKYFKTEAP